MIPVPAAWFALAASALASVALPQSVELVGASGGMRFSGLQAAIDAAADGDALVVAQGEYEAFTIDGKALTIVAFPGAVVRVQPTVAVRNLASHQAVVLSGLTVEIPHGTFAPAVVLSENAGPVRLQDCWLGQEGWSQSGFGDCEWETARDGGAALLAHRCSSLALVGCSLFGGPGQSMNDDWAWCIAGTGGAGMEVIDSAVAVYDSLLRGGRGGSTGFYGTGTGGTGLRALDSFVFASGSSLRGFLGGPSWDGSTGPGGDGAQLSGGSELIVLDCQVEGGSAVGNAPGQAVSGPGTSSVLAGASRSIEAATVVAANAPLLVAYQGDPGDTVWLPGSFTHGQLFSLGLHGAWLTAFPQSALPPRGRADASGRVSIARELAPLPPAATHGTFVVQGLAVPLPLARIVVRLGASEFPASIDDRFVIDRRLAGMRYVLALDPKSGRDDNGNGVNDLLDLVMGSSVDLNHDLTPDGCRAR